MIRHCFDVLLDMSRTASIVILIVLIARLLLKKAPKIFSYGLWMIVLFRLLFPFSFESPVSLIPKEEILDMPSMTTEVSSPHQEEIKEEYTVSPVQGEMTTVEVHRNPASFLSEFFKTYDPFLWIAGVFFIGLYSLASYLKLRGDIGETVYSQEEDLYYGDHIPSPFVFGFLHPAIYLPSSLKEEEKNYVLLHEKTHIQRGDHIIKALFWLVLCIHWFNPLVWISFVLMESDMEMSCDEKVLKILGEDKRASYSKCLLDLSVGRSSLISVPLAFGEGGLKRRLSNLFHYKKPVLWVSIAALLLCTVLGVSLLSDPEGEWIMVEKAETTADENDAVSHTIDYRFKLDRKPQNICFTVKNCIDGTVREESRMVIPAEDIPDDFSHLTLALKPSFLQGVYDLVLVSDDVTVLDSPTGYRVDVLASDLHTASITGATIASGGVNKSASLSLRKKSAVGSDEDIFLCAFYEKPGDHMIEHVSIDSPEDLAGINSYIIVEMSYDGQYHEFIKTSEEGVMTSGTVSDVTVSDGEFFAVMDDGESYLLSEYVRSEFVYSKSHHSTVEFVYQTGYYSDDPDKEVLRYAWTICEGTESLADYLTMQPIKATVYDRTTVYDVTASDHKALSEKTVVLTGGELQTLINDLKRVKYRTCEEAVTGTGPYRSITFVDGDGNAVALIQDGNYYYVSQGGEDVLIGMVHPSHLSLKQMDFSQAAEISGSETISGGSGSKDPSEENTDYYRISDLLGDPVSIRVTATDYGSYYDRVFEGDELKELMTSLHRAVVAKDIEPVKGAGGIGLNITITYEDGTVVNAGEGNFCFRLGDDVYPYPLESLENQKTFLEQFLLTIGSLELNS